ncbi:ankyrin repeat-containing domain protein, partial [Dactylonectria macrodidyma]
TGPRSSLTSVVKHGADVNRGGQRIRTPLTAASIRGYEAVVRFLIANSADANFQNGELTPLTAAIVGGNEAVVRFLVENGADVNLQNGLTHKPPHACSTWGKWDSRAISFRECGADVNGPGKDSWTPLAPASLRGNETIFCLLVDNGANIDGSDEQICTPLAAAAWKGNDSIVRLLITKGADVNRQEESSCTPLTAAVKAHDQEMVRLLIDNGANVNADFGAALQMAKNKRYRNMAKLLMKHGAKKEDHGCARLTVIPI